MVKNKYLLVLLIVLLVSCSICVAAAEMGSLRIVDIEIEVCLYHVADPNGALTEDFQHSGVGDLSQTTDAVKIAQALAEYARTGGLSGWNAVPESAEVLFAPLEEGMWLVCSLSQPEEFSPFLVNIPTDISGEYVYHVVTKPKEEEPTQPTTPTEPSEPDPEIPQTGRSVIPKITLLILGVSLVILGAVIFYRGREREA